MNFGRPQTQFIRVMVAGLNGTTQDVAQFRLVINQPQERFAARAARTNTKNIFRGRIQADDEKACIKKNNAGVEAVENLFGVAVECAVVAGMFR